MTGGTVAALVLATAAMIAPGSPRHRLQSRTGRRSSGLRVVVPAVAILGALVVIMARPSVVLALIMVGTAATARHRRRRKDRLRRAECQAMAAALDVLVGELRVGAHPVRAFTIAGAESAGPVGAALRVVAARARLGADVAAALRSGAGGSSVPNHWRRLGICWELAAQHGVAMAVLMRAAHRDAVERLRFADRIQASLAGARATAVILGTLPLLGVLLGQLVGAHPIGFLLGGGLGGVLLVIGVGLICVGLAWADRIIGRLVP